MDLKALRQEVAPKWRIQQHFKEKRKAMCTAYIDAPTCMDIFDDAIGSENWTHRYEQDTITGNFYCHIGVKVDGEYIWKYGLGIAADNSFLSAGNLEKSKHSNAFKKASEMWGVGRFTKKIKPVWVDTDGKEKNPKAMNNGNVVWDLTEFINKRKGNFTPPKGNEDFKLLESDVLNTIEDIDTVEELQQLWIKVKDQFGSNEKIRTAFGNRDYKLKSKTIKDSTEVSGENILNQIKDCKKVKDLENIWYSTPKKLQVDASIVSEFSKKKNAFLELALDAIDKTNDIQDLQKLYDTYKETFKRMKDFHECYAVRKKELLTPSKKKAA